MKALLFKMKSALAQLFKVGINYKVNTHFLLRMESVERQIAYALEKLNYCQLNAAKYRLEWEQNFKHTTINNEIIRLLLFRIELSRELMNQKLKEECFC